VPWEAVLKDLEREMGIVIRVRGPLTGTLTQEFEAVPLEQGLRRLFRDANIQFFYAAGEPQDASTGRLIGLWLFPKERSTQEAVGSMANTAKAIPQEAVPAAEKDGLAGRLTALHGIAQQDDLEALRQAAFDPDQTIQLAALRFLAERNQQEATVVLVDATKSDEPERRLQALALLHQTGYADEMTVVAALGEALADADASVKLYAIQGLAERRGSDAIGSLRHALRDPDPSVRMIVIDGLVPEGQGLALLQEALSDEDETLRSAAASKLDQAVSEDP
jgi:hypothetical protein